MGSAPDLGFIETGGAASTSWSPGTTAAMLMAMTMSGSTVHVQPNPEGRWIVRHEGEREPVSVHASASEAERVASELARSEGASLVLPHDRYARVHRLRTDVR